MALTIHSGDIFSVTAEALIVPANRQPDLGWGSHISERVGKLAAPVVREQRAQAGTLALGEACLTSGEGTGFKHLVHAAVLDKYDFNPLFLLRLRQRTADATLAAAIASTIQVLAQNGVCSAALSAMGSGIGGMGLAKCLRILFPPCLAADCQFVFAARKPREVRIANEVLASVR